MENIMKVRKATIDAIGATLRCINSDGHGFEVGKDYKVRGGSFFGMIDALIGKNDFSLNGFSGGYYKVEGEERVIARFKMIKDSKGRYVKRARILSIFSNENRRTRRMARQALKVSGNGVERKVLKGIARNDGK